MNFIEAVKQAKNGKKIRASYWDKNDYLYMDKEDDLLYYGNSTMYPIGKSTILCEQWELYEEKVEPCSKTYTFQEAFKALKNGKKIDRISKYNKDERGFGDSRLDMFVNNKWQHVFVEEDIEAADWIIKD